jgi:hypothetical protein
MRAQVIDADRALDILELGFGVAEVMAGPAVIAAARKGGAAERLARAAAAAEDAGEAERPRITRPDILRRAAGAWRWDRRRARAKAARAAAGPSRAPSGGDAERKAGDAGLRLSTAKAAI